MKNIFIGLIITVLNLSIQAQNINSYEIFAEFFPNDAKMYNYPVSPEAFLRAHSTIVFLKLTDDDIIFYLHGEFKIDSILVGSKMIEYAAEKVFYYYSYNMVALQVTISSSNVTTDEIKIYYSGFMNPSRARSLSDYMYINKNKGVYLRSYGYSLWFPIFLKSSQDSYKANFKSITIKLPANYKCIVNGELINEFVEKDIYTAIWRPGVKDIVEIQCTAQDYKINSKNNVYVYYLSDKSSSELILDYASQLKKIYSKNLKSINESLPLYIMEMPKYGDISSGNVVGISEKDFNSFNNGLQSKRLIAHELVHPYVYIPVLVNNNFYAFVVEGFPSFFQVYALKRMEGETYNLKEEMKKVEELYLEKRKTGKTQRGNTLPAEKAILNIKFDELGYYKDQFVLNDRVYLFFYTIWNKMGDEKFDNFLQELFRFTSINYEVFEQLILKYIPDYRDNLNIWLNTTNYPEEIQIRN